MNDAESAQISLLKDKQVNWELIRQDLAELVGHLHNELGWFDEESVTNTPRRVMRFYREFYEDSNRELAFTKFKAPAAQSRTLILLRKIRTYSLCQHHMLPFESRISIGYLPSEGGGICGLSKLSRVAVKFSSMPAMQEQLTQQIVDFVNEQLHPLFVMCVVEGKHHCSMIRGAKQPAALFTTSALRWDENEFSKEEAERTRIEFMRLIKCDAREK